MALSPKLLNVFFLCLSVLEFNCVEMESVQYPPAFLRAVAGPWVPCEGIEKDCVCQGNAANCTDKYGMTSIPRFAENITSILFYGYNGSQKYTSFDDDFFRNVTNITELYVGGSFFILEKAKALRTLHQLTVLCFESVTFYGSSLKLEVVRYIPTLREIYFSSVDMTIMFHLLEPKQTKSDLTTLYIRRGHPTWQRPMDFNFGTLQPLEKLRSVTIEDTYIRYQSFKFELLPPLEQLALRGIGMARFPVACADSYSNTYFPRLTHLYLDRGGIIDIPSIHCYDKLTHLSLQYNNLNSLNGNEFSHESFPHLKFLSLKRAGFFSAVPAFEFKNPSLKHLDLSYLSYNDLDFASEAVNEGLFDGCTKLSSVNLEGNDFSKVSTSKLHRMFGNLTELRVVSLARTQLSPVNKNTFAAMLSVTELDLSGNKLSDIADGVFDDLYNLTVLRLDNNALTTISETTFSTQLRHSLQSLNLSHNSFQCTCSLLWFRKWLVSNPGLFDLHNPYSRYDCHNLPGTDVANFFLIEQQCLLSHEAYVFTVVYTAVLTCTLTVAILLYRFRWHIRLVLYETFRGGPQAGWRRRRLEEFRYDLFVCYDSENADWVQQQLMPTLEEGWGLRLCVHQRDFIPGKNITDNIVDCLQASKRVLAIFSSSFAESQWCNFELELCLSHVIDNHDVMVVVMLEDLSSRDLTSAMLALLKTTTYIEWGYGEDAAASFWQRLTLAVTDVLPALKQ